MAERRKDIGKKVRFEVFKRDKFTCQYCGRMAPDVILEVDHIRPVAEGGNNGMTNLITSCRDCNRGKGKVRLTDNAELKKQQDQLAELATKREQMELMMQWRESLLEFEREKVLYAKDYFESLTGFEVTDAGIGKLDKLVREFELPNVLTAMDISVSQYFTDDGESAAIAFGKLGGICYNRKNKE